MEPTNSSSESIAIPFKSSVDEQIFKVIWKFRCCDVLFQVESLKTHFLNTHILFEVESEKQAVLFKVSLLIKRACESLLNGTKNH